MNIFSKIGLFFVGLFNAAKKAFEGLSEAQQQALISGSGIVAIFNDMLLDAPEAIRKAIAERFPELDEPKLESALFELASHFGISFSPTEGSPQNLEDLIILIQTYLLKQKNKNGKLWAIASHGAASVLAVLFAPPETKVASVVSLLEWVYQEFVKKSTKEAPDA
jgi:hypothetical protein